MFPLWPFSTLFGHNFTRFCQSKQDFDPLNIVSVSSDTLIAEVPEVDKALSYRAVFFSTASCFWRASILSRIQSVRPIQLLSDGTVFSSDHKGCVVTPMLFEDLFRFSCVAVSRPSLLEEKANKLNKQAAEEADDPTRKSFLKRSLTQSFVQKFTYTKVMQETRVDSVHWTQNKDSFLSWNICNKIQNINRPN